MLETETLSLLSLKPAHLIQNYTTLIIDVFLLHVSL